MTDFEALTPRGRLRRLRALALDALREYELEVERCSCEGIAAYLFELFEPQVRAFTGGRVSISAVEVEEDSKNSARYTPSAGRA